MLTYFKLFFTIPKVINTIDFGIIATLDFCLNP